MENYLLLYIFPERGIVQLISKYAKSKKCLFTQCTSDIDNHAYWFCTRHLCRVCLNSKFEHDSFCSHCTPNLDDLYFDKMCILL